jgi:hypothetical protein
MIEPREYRRVRWPLCATHRHNRAIDRSPHPQPKFPQDRPSHFPDRRHPPQTLRNSTQISQHLAYSVDHFSKCSASYADFSFLTLNSNCLQVRMVVQRLETLVLPKYLAVRSAFATCIFLCIPLVDLISIYLPLIYPPTDFPSINLFLLTKANVSPLHFVFQPC